ncbi:protein of unknown function [Streptantibioticus cattleyicolor NRRL 8057 = DSM 46488]|nr:protein of unknown function [Streptantibioticus cattleyicolor NRRL 8057 = DSM 46488]
MPVVAAQAGEIVTQLLGFGQAAQVTNADQAGAGNVEAAWFGADGYDAARATPRASPPLPPCTAGSPQHPGHPGHPRPAQRPPRTREPGQCRPGSNPAVINLDGTSCTAITQPMLRRLTARERAPRSCLSSSHKRSFLRITQRHRSRG